MKRNALEKLILGKDTFAMVFKGGEEYIRKTTKTKNNKMFDFVKL